MKQRGRKAAAELDMAPAATTALIERPDAPYDLSDEEAAEWWGIVQARPADYFTRETHGMLADYCRHIVKSRRVADMVRALEAEVKAASEEDGRGDAAAILDAVRGLDRLYKMAERESRAISSLATRMRLSQQSNIRADAAANRPGAAKKRPWE